MHECDGAGAPVTLQDLPEAMLLRIISDLTKPSDICNLGATCRFLQAVCSSETVWQLRCHNLETGISNLDHWRTHMDSYRALFQFLWRARELLGLWSLLDTERLRTWDNGDTGNFIIGLWGFLSVVVCYVNKRGGEHWRPVFELFSLSNGTFALVYPQNYHQLILPAAVVPPTFDGSTFDGCLFIDFVTTNGVDDLRNSIVDQDCKDQEGTESEGVCEEAKVNEELRRFGLKVNEELARFGHFCKPPVARFCIDSACDELQDEPQVKCLSNLRAAVRSLPSHCKAVVLHPSRPPRALRSRWGLCMRKLDTESTAGRFAGLWVGKYGRPGEVNLGRGPYRSLLFFNSEHVLFLNYGESGKLKGTKLLGEPFLPLLQPFFDVKCEDPDSPGLSPDGHDLAKWLWKEADGSYPEITGWFRGEGTTSVYNREIIRCPGMLVVENTGDLAFMWSPRPGLEQAANRSPATLRLQRVVNYREYLLSIERKHLPSLNEVMRWGWE